MSFITICFDDTSFCSCLVGNSYIPYCTTSFSTEQSETIPNGTKLDLETYQYFQNVILRKTKEKRLYLNQKNNLAPVLIDFVVEFLHYVTKNI